MNILNTGKEQQNQIVELGVTDAAISAIKEKWQSFSAPIGDVLAYKELSAGLKEVRKIRTTIEKARKEKIREALDWQKMVNSEAKRITYEIEPLESRLKENKDLIDQHEEKIRKQKEEEEAKRIQSIKEMIRKNEKLKDLPLGSSSATIQGALNEALNVEINDDYQEFKDEAIASLNVVVGALKSLLKYQLDNEKKEAELEAERKRVAELEEARKKQEAEIEAMRQKEAELEAERKQEQTQIEVASKSQNDFLEDKNQTDQHNHKGIIECEEKKDTSDYTEKEVLIEHQETVYEIKESQLLDLLASKNALSKLICSENDMEVAYERAKEQIQDFNKIGSH